LSHRRGWLPGPHGKEERLLAAAHLIVLMALRHCRHAGLVLGRAVGRLPADGAFGVCIQEVALSRRLVHDGRQGQEGDEGCPRGDAHLLSFRRCIRGRSRFDARPFFFRGMRPLSKTAVERSYISTQSSDRLACDERSDRFITDWIKTTDETRWTKRSKLVKL